MRLVRNMNNKIRFLFSALVVGSFFMLMLVPAAEPAGAGSCPPGWSSCNLSASTLGCCTWLYWLEERIPCTEWEPDPNYSYPDCRYRVKRHYQDVTCFPFVDC